MGLRVNLHAFNSWCFGHQNKKPFKDFETFFRMARYPVQKMKGHLIIDISILLPKIIGVDIKSAKQSDNNGNVNFGRRSMVLKRELGPLHRTGLIWFQEVISDPFPLF